MTAELLADLARLADLTADALLDHHRNHAAVDARHIANRMRHRAANTITTPEPVEQPAGPAYDRKRLLDLLADHRIFGAFANEPRCTCGWRGWGYAAHIADMYEAGDG